MIVISLLRRKNKHFRSEHHFGLVKIEIVDLSYDGVFSYSHRNTLESRI